MKPYVLKPLIISLVLLLAITVLHASNFADTTVSWMSNHGFSPVLNVLIISMLPLIELRGSIPIAIIIFKMPWYEAVLLSLIGNMIPIPLILLFIEAIFKLMNKVPIGARFTEWLFARTRRKGKVIERYEALGLIIFVGIPLPGTGAWTGAFAARIFGIPFWKSMLYILLGVILASGIVTLLSMMGKMAIH